MRTERHGFITRIDFDVIAKAIDKVEGEVVLQVSIGSFIAFQDVVAEVKTRTLEDAAATGEIVKTAIRLERQRDITTDPSYGIKQLEMIAWTSISTAKSNPAPGLLTIFFSARFDGALVG